MSVLGLGASSRARINLDEFHEVCCVGAAIDGRFPIDGSLGCIALQCKYVPDTGILGALEAVQQVSARHARACEMHEGVGAEEGEGTMLNSIMEAGYEAAAADEVFCMMCQALSYFCSSASYRYTSD